VGHLKLRRIYIGRYPGTRGVFEVEPGSSGVECLLSRVFRLEEFCTVPSTSLYTYVCARDKDAGKGFLGICYNNIDAGCAGKLYGSILS